MLLLALDTSTPVISVAISKQGKTVACLAYDRGRSNTAHLLSAIDTVLAHAALTIKDCDAVACAVGPGSFTGLRVGVATAQGLAEGCGLKVVGVPTLEAYAHELSGVEGLICPIIDARKQELYVAGYRWEAGALGEVWSAKAMRPEQLSELIEERGALLCGDGAAVYRSQLAAALGERAAFGPTDLALSNASRVARLGAERLAQGEAVEASALRPIYGRPSEAELTTG